MKTAAQWLLVICMPVLLLTAAIGVTANILSFWLGDYGYDKYNVSQRLSTYELELDKAEIERVYNSLVDYFNSGGEYIDLVVVNDGQRVKLFTDEETIHFKDVKGLIRLDYWLFIGTLIYMLAFLGLDIFWLKDRRRLARPGRGSDARAPAGDRVVPFPRARESGRNVLAR